ncbi:hypothetical protein UYO_0852 [Lachnospiraceae bacterium JC7]|nr:hypothetical protein UYO_0852 [Lachnospiraceae bacterium JC7]
MNLSNLLKDPIDIPLLFIYVVGVLIMVYSAMQFVHGFLYKQKPYIRSGVKTLIIAVVLLAPRLAYQHIRVDGSDYRKAVKASIRSVSEIFDSSGTAESANLKAQLDGLSERLLAMGYAVTFDSSVETGEGGNVTLRNLCAVKTSSEDDANADIMLISTSLNSGDTEGSFTAGAAGISVMEAVAEKLQKTDTTAEIRLLVSEDGRAGQDAAHSYLDSLTEDEKNRIIGNISFDLMGLSDYTGFETCTVNGVDNPLSAVINSSVKRMTGQKLSIAQNKGSETVSFQINGIPGVLLKQAYVDKADTAKSIDKLNEDEIADAAAIIGDVITGHMRSADSELLVSLRSVKADALDPYTAGSFRKDRDSFESSGSLRAISENFGTALRDTDLTDASGSKLYEGRLYLLTFDTPASVLFHVNDEGLRRVTVDSAAIKASKEELTQILKNLFGDPEEESGILSWKDERSGARYCIAGTDCVDAVSSMTGGGYSFYLSSY